MDASIAKKTQETLGKVIKKPPLTDKLLGKPPFRFLHDIITEVTKNTGFFKGLYNADDMNSANVKEKDAKIAFLQKAIDVVVIVSGTSLTMKPSKVVAGHEPEKTNEFLQVLGKVIIAKKSSSEAVKRVLGGDKPGKGSADGKRKDRSSSRDREKAKDKDADKKEERRKDSAKGSSDRKRREDSGKKEKEKEKESEPKKSDRSQEKEKLREKEPDKERLPKKEEDSTDAIDSGQAEESQEDSDLPPNRMPRPTSAKGQRRRPADGEGDESQESETNGVTGTDSSPIPTEQMNGVLNGDQLPPQVTQSRRMARPSSARPAPPKIKKQQEELEDQVGRIGSGKQVASVIVDDGKDDDDDEIFVVEDPHADTNHIDSTPSNESLDQEADHGGLVRKILETKKELEGSNEQQVKPRQDKSIPMMSDAARRKERELVQKEIEKLRNSIQTLTRSANPLGKIMDYVQEDVDSMNKELEMWRTENKDHTVALKREQSITDNEIEPLRAQLGELDAEILDMVDRISTVKCNILKNDERIQKMLSSISFNSR